MKKWFAYFLELEDDWYYVGISQDPVHRLHAHKTGQGSQLSQRHPVKNILGVWDIHKDNEFSAKIVEKELTRGFTRIYGEKVRGAGKCKEDSGYIAGLNPDSYLKRFDDVTKETLEELNLVELRGWG